MAQQLTSNSYSFIDSSYRSLCLADTAAHQAKLGGGYFGSLINSSKTDTITVHCPVPKTTSGPAAWYGDDFWSATIPVLTNGPTVSCEIDIYGSSPQSFPGTNLLEVWPGEISTNGTITLGAFGASLYGNYWGGGDTGNDWMYLDLACTLPPGTALGLPPYTNWPQYTITEDGAPQPQRIYPASNCREDAGNGNHNWNYQWDDMDGYGGYIYGNQDQNGALKFDCAVPDGTNVQMALGPAIGYGMNNTVGCNMDNSNLSTMTWPTTPDDNGGSFPVEIIPLSTQPPIRVPSTGTHKLVCGYMLAGNGDGDIVSYRTSP
jgi:hypothetical protein